VTDGFTYPTGRLVVAAVQIGAGPGQARVPLVEPGLVAAASVSHNGRLTRGRIPAEIVYGANKVKTR
jgi:hypothetical protein